MCAVAIRSATARGDSTVINRLVSTTQKQVKEVTTALGALEQKTAKLSGGK